MKINIKQKDCQFIISEQSHEVTCIIEGARTYLEKFVDVPFKYFLKYLSTDNTMPNRFVGKAVCAPEDTWNEELGRLIAFEKAKFKFAECFFRTANRFISQMDEEIDTLIERTNAYGGKLERNSNRRIERIKALLG